MRGSQGVALSGIFFLSGAAALTFENLWFRQAALTFGSSVWASALVLSAFMAGLALGNGLMARHGERARRPLRWFAGLELVVASTGVLLVLVLPRLGAWLAPAWRPLLESPHLLHPARLSLSFLLLLLPTTAMGATLPLLVKALTAADPGYGSALGRLYGWNTIGGVAGALACEAVLVRLLGLNGAALAAGGLDLLAAGLALVVGARSVGRARVSTAGEPLGLAGATLLAAAALGGGILLAFEVVWFRFLKLFVYKGSLTFAVMLAVVLAGIGLGGLVTGRWLGRDERAHRFAPATALAAGALAVLLYGNFARVVETVGADYIVDPKDVVSASLALMFPVAALSGVLFTLIGARLERRVRTGTRATGLLTLANTLGAAVGALAGGFVLLPRLGMEGSFFALAACYLIVAALLVSRQSVAGWRERVAATIAATALLLALALFPFGLMSEYFFPRVGSAFGPRGASSLELVREGTNETILLLRSEHDGELLSHKLLTDGFSMASNDVWSRRYMKLFVYLPMALAPESKSALLVSYGIGSTAKALTDTKGLDRIDVVDISREILALGETVFRAPATPPLDDPRVQVFVEDGRFFLQATERRYDLITSEPPPPLHAGVVSLYTREYFQLIRDHLTEGGLNTYWLPVHLLSSGDTRAITRAYCDVFADCSMWTGAGDCWMLLGSRGSLSRPAEEAFSRQWRDPVVAPELAALGLELPEQLGATFVADAEQLATLVAEAEPVVDNWPRRLAGIVYLTPEELQETFELNRAWIDTDTTAGRFAASDLVRRVWPAALRERTPPYFQAQRLVNEAAGGSLGAPPPIAARLPALDAVLTRTSLEALPAWLLGVNADLQRVAIGRRSHGRRGWLVPTATAIARREWALAAQEAGAEPGDPDAVLLRLYALARAERRSQAAAERPAAAKLLAADPARRAALDWLAERFELGRDSEAREDP